MMNTPPTNDPIPVLSADALLEWEQHAEAVLRGVAHALNNRAASVSAVMELCGEPDYTPDSTRSLLAIEVERLHELVAVVRAVGVPRGGLDAFEPAEAAHVAAKVLGLHAALRDRTVRVDAAGASPVRAYRWMFIRALVVLVGRSAAMDRAAQIALVIRDVGECVEATVSPVAPGESAFLAESVAALGGDVLHGSAGFRVPTLAALRRREGR